MNSFNVKQKVGSVGEETVLRGSEFQSGIIPGKRSSGIDYSSCKYVTELQG